MLNNKRKCVIHEISKVKTSVNNIRHNDITKNQSGRFFWENPNPDHESIKSTLWVDSSHHIQIRSFEIQNLSVFFGKGFEKSIFDRQFSEQNWYTTDLAVHVCHSN